MHFIGSGIFRYHLKLFRSIDRANIKSNIITAKMERTIAIGQMRATNNKLNNRQNVQHIVESAAQKGACFVFLPKCCDYVGSNREETIALAEPLDGETVTFYRQLAKQNNIWMSLGGFHEAVFNEAEKKISRTRNAHVILSNTGEIKAVYRKMHLFDVDTPEFRFRESSITNAGNRIVEPLKDTPLIGGLGLLVCYDIRFPEASTLLRKHGAKFLTYPSAFAYTTGVAHWETLLRARAIENQCYVIAPAQVGYHNEKRRSYGHGMIVDPWGRILVECDDSEELQCRTVTIDVNVIDSISAQMPCFEHRRDNVYAQCRI